MTAIARPCGASRRFQVWRSTLLWVLCAAVTGSLLLRFSRNLRVGDTKGTAQFFAADTRVGVPTSSDTATWMLFADIAAHRGLSRQVICSALQRRAAGSPPIRVIWTTADGEQDVASGCADATVATATARRQNPAVASAMLRSHLGLMLVNGSGRYVFGGRGDDADIAALSMFAARR